MKKTIIWITTLLLLITLVQAGDYQRTINFTSGYADTGLTIKLEIDVSAWTDLNATCNNVQFENTTETEQYPFFVYNCNPSGITTYYINHTYVSTGLNQFLVKYGDSFVNETSSLSGVFIVYDDFGRADSGSLGNTNTSQAWSELERGGTCAIESNTLKCDDNAGDSTYASLTPTFPSDYVVEEANLMTDNTAAEYATLLYTDQNNEQKGIRHASSDQWKYFNSGSTTSFSPSITATANSWENWALFEHGTDYDIYLNGTNRQLNASEGSVAANSLVTLSSYSAQVTYDSYMDDLRLYKGLFGINFTQEAEVSLGSTPPTITVDAETSALELTNISFNITFANYNISTYNATLYFNNSAYATYTYNASEDNTIAIATLITPIVDTNNTNITYYFNYDLDLNNGTSYLNQNTTETNITIIWNGNPFEINATNFFNQSQILAYNVTVNGTTYTSNASGIIRTQLRSNSPTTHDVLFWGNSYYQNATYTATNVSSELEGELYPSATTFMRLYARGWLDTLPSNLNITVVQLDESQQSNPFVKDVLTLINRTNQTRTIRVIIEDLNEQYQTYNNTVIINTSQYELNITLTPNRLALYFVNSTGAAQTTNGTVYDLNNTRTWSNSELVVVQQNLTQGIVKVHFGLTAGTNWTQYYEYLNNLSTYINETIEIIDDPTKRHWFRVMSPSHSPLENAIIQVEAGVSNTLIEQDYELVGRRLTDVDGFTSFFFDPDSQVKVTVTATGYTPQIFIFSPLDLDHQTQATRQNIYMEYNSASITIGDKTVIQPRYTYNKSEDMTITILNLDESDLTITTSYYADNGGSAQAIVCNIFDICTFTLISDTYFDSTTTNNITISIYDDGILIYNETTTYVASDYNEILSIPTTLPRNILLPILFIALIIISVTVSMVFKNTNAGVTTFFIGSLIMCYINLWYIAVAITTSFYWTGDMLKRIISK